MTNQAIARTLQTSLHEVRQHAVGAVEGLDEVDLRRALLPSGWTSLALINHLTLDVEQFWFRAIVEGDPATISGLGTDADGWQVQPGTPAETILTAYRQECAHADEVLADVAFEASPAWWPEELFGEWRLETVGEIVMHVIVETSCHAGHLDAARELIDGRQWMVLT